MVFLLAQGYGHVLPCQTSWGESRLKNLVGNSFRFQGYLYCRGVKSWRAIPMSVSNEGKGFWFTPFWGALVTNHPHGPVLNVGVNLLEPSKNEVTCYPISWRNHSLESINEINFWTVTETLNKRNNNWRDSQSVHSQEKPTPRVWVLVCLKSLASGGLVEVECASVSFFPPTAVELGRDLRDGHVHTGIPQARPKHWVCLHPSPSWHSWA